MNRAQATFWEDYKKALKDGWFMFLAFGAVRLGIDGFTPKFLLDFLLFVFAFCTSGVLLDRWALPRIQAWLVNRREKAADKRRKEILQALEAKKAEDNPFRSPPERCSECNAFKESH